MIRKSRIALHTLAFAVLFAPLSVDAQLSLPDAREVLKRYATATGAATAATMPGIRMQGTYDVPSAGLSGTFESLKDKSGRTMQMINITSIGMMLSGSDSTFAWSFDPVQGPRVLKGDEFAQTREEEDVRSMTRDPALVIEARSMIRTSINGEDCVLLQLKWKSGRVSKECYSEKTGLLLQAETTQLTSMGAVPVTRVYGEYKKFGALMAPAMVTEKAQGLEGTYRVVEVSFEAIDPSRFAPPPQVRALRPGG